MRHPEAQLRDPVRRRLTASTDNGIGGSAGGISDPCQHCSDTMIEGIGNELAED